MNIQNIKETVPIDSRVEFVATILECKEIKTKTKSEMSQSPGEQYNIQKLKVKDATGQISVWAFVNKTFQFLPGQQVKISGIVKEHMNQKYLHYCQLTLMQGPQNAPQNSSQTPQTTPQSTNAYQNAQQAVNQLQQGDILRVRTLAMEMSVSLICSGKIEYSYLFDQADDFINYIIHKRHPQEVAGVNSNPTMDEEHWPPEN